jgi:hypothetical protein
MKSQVPKCSFFTTLRGVEINNPGAAPVEGVEYGADGPGGDLLGCLARGRYVRGI